MSIPNTPKIVQHLLFISDFRGQSALVDINTMEVFCYCNEENADIILDAIIVAYKM